jgi:hypothetical protein
MTAEIKIPACWRKLHHFLKVLFMTMPMLTFAESPAVLELYNQSPAYILTPDNLMEMNHALVIEKLHDIIKMKTAIGLKQVGLSAEGRSINMLSFGSGTRDILLWSQMHGDEPTATAALLAVFNFFAKNSNTPFVQFLYKNLDINAIVMLNPDGAERFVRRNAQGIDVNRDANRLATPEGRILKQMAGQINPLYGFNLHDMGGRETVGKSGKLLSIALMAPPYNEADEDNPSRLRAKRMAVFIKEVLDQLIPGHVARYKADYMPRAFGDAFQSWGVSTVLVESGLSDSNEPQQLVRLNFVILLSAFAAIADQRIEAADTALYEQIPLEGVEVCDLLIKDALVYNGRDIAPFKADIGINVDYRRDKDKIVVEGLIDDIGDLSETSGRVVIDAREMIVMPGFILQGKTIENADGYLKQGITTVISDAIVPLKDLPAGGLIEPQLIPVYTLKAAQALNLTKRGLIDTEMNADLLLFRQPATGPLTLRDLCYVIKDGQIVLENP